MAARKKDDDAIDMEEEDGGKFGPIQFETTKPEVPDGPIATVSDRPDFFDIVPMRKPCKYCSVEIVTYIEKEAHPLFGLAAIMVVFIFGLLSFIILPIAYFLTQNVVHRCSRCLQKLGEKSCYGMPDDFKAEVWHFRLGKCSIVTSRIYAIIAILLFSIFCCGYVYMRPSWDLNQNPLFHHNIESKKIDATWKDYLVDCGGSAVIENQVHAKMRFNEAYENNEVAWKGYFAEVKARQTGVALFGSDHHLSILIKMAPSESEIYADLVVSISTQQYEKRRALYDALNKGDEVAFNAVLVSMGNEFKMHHLHGKGDMQKTGARMELGDIVVNETALP